MSKSTTVMIDKEHRDMLKEIAQSKNRKMVEQLHEMIEEEWVDLQGDIRLFIQSELNRRPPATDSFGDAGWFDAIEAVAHKLGMNVD